MTIVIEANVPIPAVNRGGRRESIYPFAELQPGESFWLPQPSDLEATKFTRRMASATAAAAKRLEGRKFTARSVDRDGLPGVRVWRTA